MGDSKTPLDRSKVATRRFHLVMHTNTGSPPWRGESRSLPNAIETLHNRLMKEGLGAHATISCVHTYEVRKKQRFGPVLPVAEAARTKFTVYWQPAETRLGTEAASVIATLERKRAAMQEKRANREARELRRYHARDHGSE